MKRIAVIGGGISGVAAAYELTRRQQDFILYEASPRLGGIVETIRGNGFVMECGPDGWITEKPWARELAVDLGLESELIFSNDSLRRTYLLDGQKLIAMPDRMRMMVPGDWAALLHSDLFTWQAKLAYLREPKRAEELRRAAPEEDESVSSFVRRHFGDEVADKVAAPLLSGVFGGSIQKLSVRAVMPAFVKMEREHGSLITALRQKESARQAQPPIFTTLKGGTETLVERATAHLARERIRLSTPVKSIRREQSTWIVQTDEGQQRYDEIILCTPAHITRELLESVAPQLVSLLPMEASSAIVIAFAFAPKEAARMRIPRGFGYLGAQHAEAAPSLLACTFVHQKYSHRVPEGGLLLRGFFGGDSALSLEPAADSEIVSLALRQLALALGPLPDPCCTVVRRWPLSLPQYAVGHLDRLASIEQLASSIPGLHLIGNAYRGVGLPDLIRDGRGAARRIVEA